MKIQKAATPIEGHSATLSETASRFQHERPNAVVLEKSTAEEGDSKIRRETAMRSLAEKLSADDDNIGDNPNSDHASAVPEQEGAEHMASSMLRTLTCYSMLELSSTMLESEDVHAPVCTSRKSGH